MGTGGGKINCNLGETGNPRKSLTMASSGESGEEESEVQVTDERKGKISEYEKQRISRIAENKARLEALGIPKAATAILGPSREPRGKRNSGEEDDDYRPGEADEDEEEIDESECDDEDEDFLGDSVSVSSKSKLKSKTSASKRKVSPKKNVRRAEDSDDDGDDDDDDDLKKAIALSLQDSPVAGGSGAGSSKKRRSGEEAGGKWKKKKPELTSRMQMTEDELVIYFYQFDEAGKGFITVRDVAKMAMVHDFTWIDEELQDMIRCFDMDKDGKLSLDEFKKIVTRCRMLKES